MKDKRGPTQPLVPTQLSAGWLEPIGVLAKNRIQFFVILETKFPDIVFIAALLDQKNKMGTSPGREIGLALLNQLRMEEKRQDVPIDEFYNSHLSAFSHVLKLHCLKVIFYFSRCSPWLKNLYPLKSRFISIMQIANIGLDKRHLLGRNCAIGGQSDLYYINGANRLKVGGGGGNLLRESLVSSRHCGVLCLCAREGVRKQSNRVKQEN